MPTGTISLAPLTVFDALPACGDMPGELRGAIARKGDGLYELRADGQIAGVALADEGNTAFLSVCVFPEQRGRGLGMSAAKELEQRLQSAGAKRIMCSYPAAKRGSRLFSEKLGYRRSFSSAYMTYRGGPFALSPLSVRPYRDEDYDEAHALYAEAFHIMRQGTGDFPSSVPEAPSDTMRRYWAETADERFVCLENGSVAAYAHLLGPEIGSVAVAPAMQRRGIGGKFVSYLCNHILASDHDSVTLFCIVGNPARRL